MAEEGVKTPKVSFSLTDSESTARERLKLEILLNSWSFSNNVPFA